MLLKIVTLFISPLNELHALSFYKPLGIYDTFTPYHACELVRAACKFPLSQEQDDIAESLRMFLQELVLSNGGDVPVQ